MDSESTEKYTFEAGNGRLWGRLTRNQQRFAIAMLEFPTKKDAAIAVGLEPQTVYRWPDEVDQVIDRLIKDAADSAYEILKDSVVKAAAIKRAGLDSEDERMRQSVSTEILDRVLGRATQHLEHTGEDGGPIEIADARAKYLSYLDSIIAVTATNCAEESSS